MSNMMISAAVATAVFIGMIILLEIGRRLGSRRLAQDTEGGRAGHAAVEGAIFALLGLLVAFTFSGATSRFDNRRQLVIEEANAISTAWLRLDLLPDPDRAALRDFFRQYLDARLEVYRRLPDIEAAREQVKVSLSLQKEIWDRAAAACRAKAEASTSSLLLAALNEMFDITTSRTMAAQVHPPLIIFILLILLALGCALLAGFGMAGGKSRSWTHMIGFAAVIGLTIYVILDIEYPRLGLIRVDLMDQVLIELRESMN